MKHSKNRFNLTVMGIVSIVGIVAVFFSFISINNSLALSQENLVGMATISYNKIPLCLNLERRIELERARLEAKCINITKLNKKTCERHVRDFNRTIRQHEANCAVFGVINCTDSDGGNNSAVRGTMKQFENDAGQTDSCINSKRLKEYYCDGRIGKFTFINCKDGCSDGSCRIKFSNSCKELIPGINNPSARRLNLVFTGINYDVDTIKAMAESFIDWNQEEEGLFTIEPFISNKKKFNIWYINKTLTLEGDITEWGDESGDWGYTDMIKNCSLTNWYGYVFVNKPGRSSSGFGPNSSMVVFNIDSGPVTLIHETGHLIGNLADEYPGGRQEEPMRYYHHDELPVELNMFYNQLLDNDNFISVNECRESTHWKDWVGKGCGNNDIVDCIDKYVFHKAYRLYDKDPSDPMSISLEWGTLEDEYCNYGEEENCTIDLNSKSINPFNPGEGFTSVVQEDNHYRQEMFSRDILCKIGYGGEIGVGAGECLDEVDCFQGGRYIHYNIYRPTFQSRMAGSQNFGVFNEYLIQQQINKYSD